MQIRRIILAFLGCVAVTVGWGMWQEPQISSDILASLVANEILRLTRDPFAILGLMIMILGIWVLFKAISGNQDERGLFSFE